MKPWLDTVVMKNLVLSVLLIILSNVVAHGQTMDYKEIKGILGWFVVIPCWEEDDEYDDFLFDEEEEVSCRISIEGRNVVDISLPIWYDRYDYSEAIPFDPSLEGELINITWIQNETSIWKIRIIKSVSVPSCDKTRYVITKDVNVAESLRINCHLPMCIQDIPRYMMDQINVTWYRNRLQISDTSSYRQEIKGGRFVLILNSVSYSSPGTYSCILSRKGQFLTTGEKTKVCVTNSATNIPRIFTAIKTVEAIPGSSVTIECYGNTGVGKNHKTMSQGVELIRNGSLICRGTPNSEKDQCECIDGHSCLWVRNKLHSYCEPDVVSNEQLLSEDHFNASFTLRNLTFGDSGEYLCKVFGTGTHYNASIYLRVRRRRTTHEILYFIIVLVSSLLLLFIILTIVIKLFWIESRYLFKMVCTRFQLANQTYVAYLLYSTDAFANSTQNPVSDTMKWLETKDYKWYDPHRCEDITGERRTDAGVLIPAQVREALDDSLCLIVIVTRELINENTWKLFEVYEGFEKRIKKGFRIVFICNKETEKMIHERTSKNGDRDKTCVTFQRLMKMQKNYVIDWREGSQSHFNRSLYVALPKLRYLKSKDEFTECA